MKIEQRKVQGREWEPSMKQTALLASPIYREQAQKEEKKTYKKRSQNWATCLFWVGPPSCLEDFSFACQIKVSCNWAVSNTGLSFQHFVVARQNWGNHTLPQHNLKGNNKMWSQIKTNEQKLSLVAYIKHFKSKKI